MSVQGSGGRTVALCHYCRQPVQFTGHPIEARHLDDTPPCVHGNVLRWIDIRREQGQI